LVYAEHRTGDIHWKTVRWQEEASLRCSPTCGCASTLAPSHLPDVTPVVWGQRNRWRSRTRTPRTKTPQLRIRLTMHLLTGTSGFGYKEWKGSFYPADLPASRFLSYYAERFPAVEINNTFYRMPVPDQLTAWRAEVPPEFRFILKAPRQITHIKRLRDVEQPVARLLEVSASLEEARGPLLFQLPPNMKKDVDRLRGLLE